MIVRVYAQLISLIENQKVKILPKATEDWVAGVRHTALPQL